MRNWFAKKNVFNYFSKISQKKSHVSKIMDYHPVGHPVWTPKNYAALSEEGYQNNVIVYRCINLIARGIGSVPWVLYQHEGKRWGELERHPLLNLLTSPSPRHAESAFMEAIVSYLLLSGNAYIEAVFDLDGYPCELYPLRPDRMKVVPGNEGIPKYYEYSVGSKKQYLPVEKDSGRSSVLHLKLFHPVNDWYGMSPIEAASWAIDQHNAVGKHNLSLLQNGGRPSGAFMVKPGPYGQPLTEEQRNTLKHDLKTLYEGEKNAGKLMILEGDCEWKEMGLSPKDLDFVEGKNISAREISQAFGVPPMLVGISGDATFANYKEARFHLWEDTILPLLDFLIAEFNLWLVPYFGENLKLSYDIDAIPALAPKREAKWAKVSACNFLTINEKRQALGYGFIENGDRLET